VIYPAGNRVLRLADFVRAFQHGRVQSYLLYLCTALVVLGVAVILGTE
jgi:hydrogenase-4 component B